jgi:hypothetical protein
MRGNIAMGMLIEYATKLTNTISKRTIAVLSNDKLTLILSLLSCLIFFLQSYARGLINGGRWDLLEAIAMADRWPHFGYTLGEIDRYSTSSPYFPGVALLAVLVKFLVGRYDIECLLFLASFFLVLLLCMTFIIYKKLDKDNITFPIYICMTLILTKIFLEPYISYAVEFKPDSISLVFFMLSLYALDVDGYKRYALLFASIFLSILCKQQSASVIIGLCVGTIMCNIYTNNEKIKIISTIIFATTCSSLLIFSIPGAIETAIIAHTAQKWVQFNMWTGLKTLRYIIFIFIAIKFVDCIEATREILNIKYAQYYVPAILYLIMQTIGGVRWGGNAGNTATGLVLCLPFAVYLFVRTIKPSPTFIPVCCTIFLAISSIHFYKNFYQYRYWSDIETSIQQQIKDMHLESIAICDDSYILVRDTGIKTIVGLYSYQQYMLAEQIITSGDKKYKTYVVKEDILKQFNVDAYVCYARHKPSGKPFLYSEDEYIDKNLTKTIMLDSNGYQVPVYIKK